MLFVIGIALALNVLVLLLKLKKGRYIDMILDGIILLSLSYAFGSTYSGLVTATVASSVVSIALFFIELNPLKKESLESKMIKELQC